MENLNKNHRLEINGFIKNFITQFWILVKL